MVLLAPYKFWYPTSSILVLNLTSFVVFCVFFLSFLFFFKRTTTIPSRKKKWCQSELTIGKDYKSYRACFVKWLTLENNEPASYEVKSSFITVFVLR